MLTTGILKCMSENVVIPSKVWLVPLLLLDVRLFYVSLIQMIG